MPRIFTVLTTMVVLGMSSAACTAEPAARGDGVHNTVVDREAAERWLQQSERLVKEHSPDGYDKVQWLLSVSYVRAALGDVEAVSSQAGSVFDDEGSRAEWRSGGDGAVRELLVSQEQQRLNGILLLSLLPARQREAVSYLQSVEETAGFPQPELWLRFGQYGGELPAGTTVDASSRQAAQLGGVLYELAQKDERAAKRRLAAMAADDRRAALGGSLLYRLMLDGNDARLFELLYLARKDLDAANLQQAVMLAVSLSHAADTAAGGEQRDSNANERLLHLMERLAELSPDIMAQTSRALAQTYLLNGEIQKARVLFEQQSKPDASWETVALGIGETAWLVDHYQQLQSPWRRTERLVQLALQVLPESRDEARHIVEYARTGLQDVPDHSRAAATGMLIRFFGRAGDPVLTRTYLEALGQLDASARSMEEAMRSLVLAYGLSGDEPGTRAALQALPDDDQRVQALIALAEQDNSAIADPLREAIELVARRNADPVHAQNEQAWADIAGAYLRAKDNAGAGRVVEAALDGGQGVIALERYVHAHLEQPPEADTGKQMWTLVQRLPGGPDGRVGYDRRARLESDIVTWLARYDRVEEAHAYLGKISHEQTQMMAMPTVAAAMVRHATRAPASLIDGKAMDAVATLIETSTRSDSRLNALMPILYHFAEKRERLPALILSLLPRRSERFCWSAAAVAGDVAADQAPTQRWLAQLNDPLCQAHALAGSAFAAIGIGMGTSEIVALVDPARVSERMAEAMMQRSARMR